MKTEIKMSIKEFISEHSNLVRVLKKGTKKERDKEAKKQKKELDEEKKKK